MIFSSSSLTSSSGKPLLDTSSRHVALILALNPKPLNPKTSFLCKTRAQTPKLQWHDVGCHMRYSLNVLKGVPIGGYLRGYIGFRAKLLKGGYIGAGFRAKLLKRVMSGLRFRFSGLNSLRGVPRLVRV